MNFIKAIVAAGMVAASTSAFAADITGAGSTFATRLKVGSRLDNEVQLAERLGRVVGISGDLSYALEKLHMLYCSNRGRSCSVPPIPMPVMTGIKAATGKALIVRTLRDGVARNGFQSRGTSRGADQIIVPRPAPWITEPPSF